VSPDEPPAKSFASERRRSTHDWPGSRLRFRPFRIAPTRGREEILAATHFGPFRDAPGLPGLGLRELRTLDRFFRFDGIRYRVDIKTAKEDEPLRGALHKVLTPFLDAQVLRGLDPAWLDQKRRRAMEEELPLFRDVAGHMLARSCPSKVWRVHFGTGAQIAQPPAYRTGPAPPRRRGGRPGSRSATR
jgi:hypothetical protein